MIYITGDMHGEEERLHEKPLRKLKEGDTLLVCGDFGFVWDDSPKERKLLEYLGSRKYTVAFLDGTHENYDLLNKCRMPVWNGGRVHRVSGNLLHLMRGQVFKIEGHTFFTFGGAGDAFCSGVLYGAWKGMSLQAAIELATASAACSLSEAGATEGMRPVAEVQKLYAEMR